MMLFVVAGLEEIGLPATESCAGMTQDIVAGLTEALGLCPRLVAGVAGIGVAEVVVIASGCDVDIGMWEACRN